MVGQMPEVDRVAANRAAIAARQERARLKEKLRSGEVSPLRVLEQSAVTYSVAARLRVTDFLMSLPAIGVTKAWRILSDLAISEKKRLGGLGAQQRERLEDFIRARYSLNTAHPALTVLAGPTAVGKGTVVQYIKEHFPAIQHSISATTRKPRPGEVDARDYYFVSDEDFDRMLAAGELLEWATVHGVHRYGTPRKPIEDAAARGQSVLLEIDLQGARQIRASMPQARLIFLAPPSWDELVNRLLTRGTETEDERARRLETARLELDAADEFDFIIINETVQLAAETIVDLMHT
jgi:guanylate kinase